MHFNLWSSNGQLKSEILDGSEEASLRFFLGSIWGGGGLRPRKEEVQKIVMVTPSGA